MDGGQEGSASVLQTRMDGGQLGYSDSGGSGDPIIQTVASVLKLGNEDEGLWMRDRGNLMLGTLAGEQNQII